MFELQLVKIDRSISRNARFEAPTCLVWSLWLRRVYGGSCKTFRCPMCPSVKIEGSLARNARFEAPTCLVWSLWLRNVYGEAAKPFCFPMCQSIKLRESTPQSVSVFF